MAARAAETQSQGATYSHGNAMDGRERAPRIVSSAAGVAGRGSRRGRGWHYCAHPCSPDVGGDGCQSGDVSSRPHYAKTLPGR